MANVFAFQLDLGPEVQKAQETLQQMSSFVIGDAAGDIANSYLQKSAEAAKAEMEMIIQQIETQVEEIAVNGAKDLYKALGLNEETIQLARTVIKIANSGANFAQMAVMKGLVNINNFDTMAIPMSAMAAGLQIIASFTDMFYKEYIEAYGKYINTVVEFITDPGAAFDALKDMLWAMLEQLVDLIDQQMQKYLGLSMAQIKYYCRNGYSIWKQYKEAKKRAVNGETVSVNINVQMNPDVLKEQLYAWLRQQRDSLYNGFMILQVMDAIRSVREMIKSMTNVNLATLGDGINSLDDLVNLMDELGLGDDSTAIDLSMIPKLNINEIYASMNSLTDTSRLVNDVATLGGIAATSFDINATTTTRQLYDVQTDPENKVITVTFFEKPTKSSVSRRFYKLLNDTRGPDGKKSLFSAGEVKMIQESVNNAYSSSQEDITVNGRYYTVRAVFKIEEKQQSPKDVVSKDIQKQKKEASEPKVRVELAVMEEEKRSGASLDKQRSETRRNTIALLHTVYGILKSMLPILTKFAMLVQNYKTNKAYVAGGSRQNLFQLYEEVMQKLGFNKTIDMNSYTDDNGMQHHSTTVYTIRTLSLYNFIKSLGLAKGSGVQFTISREDAVRINRKITELDDGSLRIDTAAHVIMLFIDFVSIRDEMRCREQRKSELGQLMDESLVDVYIDCQSKYKNGTFDGIENMEVVGDKIIYSDKDSPRLPSQLLLAQMRGYKPFKKKQ